MVSNEIIFINFINCYPSPQHHDKRRRERSAKDDSKLDNFYPPHHQWHHRYPHHDKRRRERSLLTRRFEITSEGRIRLSLPANCIQFVIIIIINHHLKSLASSSISNIIIIIKRFLNNGHQRHQCRCTNHNNDCDCQPSFRIAPPTSTSTPLPS